MNKPFSAPAGTRLLPEDTRMGAVHLAVRDEARALSVWRDIIGLTLIDSDGTTLTLGTGETPLIVLHVEANAPTPQRSLGLYHVAIHVPTRRDLARFVMRAARAGMRIGPTDHLVTEAVYMWDHDNVGIEVTFETPWRGTINGTDGAYAMTVDGRPHSGREPIDLDDLMAELNGDTTPDAVLPEGTRIGHVHVHVADLDAAMKFYAQTLGFEALVMMRDWGMGDAGLGYMPHAIAFNIWAGATARQAPAGSAGLKWFEMHVPADARTDIEARLSAAGAPVTTSTAGIQTRDPSGNCLKLIFS